MGDNVPGILVNIYISCSFQYHHKSFFTKIFCLPKCVNKFIKNRYENNLTKNAHFYEMTRLNLTVFIKKYTHRLQFTYYLHWGYKSEFYSLLLMINE